jgi:dTDP-4-amino-4,6-dideoxygalactose transaminase
MDKDSHEPTAAGRVDRSASPIFVRPAHIPEELPAVRQLFREYADSLGFALDFQGFEEELAAYVGQPHVITVTSCTHALELSLRALRLA